MTNRVQRVSNDIMDLADEICGMFKPGYKVTVIARNPSHPDGSHDMIVTADDLDAVIESIRILKLTEKR